MKATYDNNEHEGSFVRIDVAAESHLQVVADEKPVAIWIPSSAVAHVTLERGAVVDIAESVDHFDVASLESMKTRLFKRLKKAQRNEKRARRRLRRLERVGLTHGTYEK